MLDRKKRYLQVALNSTLDEARAIVSQLPKNDRIIIEAGTPLIKRYGTDAIRQLSYLHPYVVADVKTIDRGATEVSICKNTGASGFFLI